MKMEELKGKTVDELHTKLAELKKELFNLRFQQAAGELSAPQRFRAARRNIARIMTQLRQVRSKKTAA